MELIDRYVNAVGKHLPQKTRADIESEIRSTLEDMLADRSAKTGQPVDEAMVKEVLKAYGAPEKVAATYLPERYLIGPRMFPMFWLVVKIVFSVLTTLAIIGMGIRLGMEPGPLDAVVRLTGRLLLEYIQGMITALGNIVLIFAILERVLPESQVGRMRSADKKEWDPEQLLREPTGEEVKLWEPVVTIVFTVAGLVIFNFNPQIIAVVINPGSREVIPLLSSAFFRYLPFLNILWVLGIVLQISLLRLGHYTPALHWFSIALKAGGVALAGVMLSGPSLVGITTGQLTAAGMELPSADVLVQLFNLVVRVSLVIGIVAGTADIIKELYRLVIRPERPQPVMTQK